MAIWRSEDSANDHGRTKRVGFSVAAGSERRDAFYAAVETYTDIGAGCHELRVTDTGGEWRLVYAVTSDAIVVLDVFKKTTRTTPQTILTRCARRLRDYHRRDEK